MLDYRMVSFYSAILLYNIIVFMDYTTGMYVMCAAFSNYLNAKMKWNFDGTQFICKAEREGALVCFAKRRTAEVPATCDCDGTLPIAIKWLHMGNAYGEVSPLFLLVAVSDMEPDIFEVYEIPGLSSTAAQGQIGYLAFAQSRCGNAALFTWYVKNIVIPTIKKLRDFYKCKVSYLSYI